MSAPNQTGDDALHHGERVIARLVALASAYRLLMGLEMYAMMYGDATHLFPDSDDRLVVRKNGHDAEYLWIDGPVDRDTAARILSTDIGRDVGRAESVAACVPDCDADHLRICSECWRTGYRGEAPCPCHLYVTRGAS